MGSALLCAPGAPHAPPSPVFSFIPAQPDPLRAGRCRWEPPDGAPEPGWCESPHPDTCPGKGGGEKTRIKRSFPAKYSRVQLFQGRGAVPNKEAPAPLVLVTRNVRAGGREGMEGGCTPSPGRSLSLGTQDTLCPSYRLRHPWSSGQAKVTCRF